MWNFNEKIDRRASNQLQLLWLCVENHNLYVDDQERLLGEQPFSQPAGFESRDFLSQPIIPDIIAAVQVATIQTNIFEPTTVIPQALAYDTTPTTDLVCV